MPRRGIHNLIYAGQGEAIFWISIVEVRVVYTHSPFIPLLWNHHYVGQPFGVFYRSDKSIMQKFINLGLDDQVAVWVKASNFLSDQLGRGGNFQLVRGLNGVDPGHITMSPGKHISIRLYNVV